MKYIKEYKLFETVNPKEMTNDKSSFFSVLYGKRNICFIGRKHPFYLELAEKNGINVIEVPKNDEDEPISYIFYKKEKEKEAKELENIALKYNGYLSVNATAEETYRIGILLEYDEDSIKQFIKSKTLYNKDPFLKTFENFNDNEQSSENTPIDPVLKSQVTKYVEEQLGSQNFHEIFDIIGVDMPQTLEGEEFEEKMDLAKEKAIDYFMRNTERMQIDKPTEFITFNVGKHNPIPTTTNIGGVVQRR